MTTYRQAALRRARWLFEEGLFDQDLRPEVWIAFLLEVGTVHVIEARIEALLSIAATFQNATHHSLLEPDEEEAVLEAFQVLGHRLEDLRGRALAAEMRLRDMGLGVDPADNRPKILPGWRYDAASRSVVREDVDAGGRTTDYVSEVIRAVHADVRKQALERWRRDGKKGRAPGQSTQAIREEIHERLRIDFPPEMIDPSPRGPIDRAIRASRG